MPIIGSLTSFTANTLAQASQVNSNFTTIRNACNSYAAWLDATSQTFTGNITINPTSGVALTVTDGGITVTTGGLTVTAGGLTVSAGGITVTGNSTITGTLGGVTTLSCTTVTATNLGGTLSTAAQTNITSVGTLTSLALSGALSGVTTLGASGVVTLSATGACLTFSGADPQIRAGSSALHIYNNAGSTELARFGTGIILGPASNHRITMNTGATDLSIANTGGLIQVGGGAGIATTATVDMLTISSMAGSPTGVVGDGAVVLDTTNHRIYLRSGGVWKYAALT